MMDHHPVKNDQIEININKNKYDAFLDKHKVSKGVAITHTTFGPPWSSYSITDDIIQEFYDIYIPLVGKTPLYMIERPKPVGQLLIDFDFKFDNPENLTVDKIPRKYSIDDIKYVILKTNQIVNNYFETDNTNLLHSYILEKRRPTLKNLDIKDGFHIVYPNLALKTEMRELILNELRDTIVSENGLKHIKFKNSMTDVVDTSVVNNNGWCMYGSAKFESQPYFLTHILGSSCEQLKKLDRTKDTLVRLLSNRKFNEEDAIPYKSTINMDNLELKLAKYKKTVVVTKTKPSVTFDDMDFSDSDNESDTNSNSSDTDFECQDNNKIVPVKKEKKKKDNNNNNPLGINLQLNLTPVSQDPKVKYKLLINQQKKMAEELTKLLSVNRATSYDTWIRVCWALYSVSDKLYPVFKDFSKKASNYDEESCKKQWDKAQNCGLSIKSLKYWAQQDSPTEYFKILRNSVNELFSNAETGTEYDIAKLVYELWGHLYCCVSIKQNIWYEFQEHRWNQIENCYTLDRRLSEDLTVEFLKLHNSYNDLANINTGFNKDMLTARCKKIMEITIKLKSNTFKEKIIKECAKMFYNNKFEEKLDSNPYLLGFENGIYDLKEHKFRPGSPDDFITFSTGYNYVNYTMEHPYVLEVLENFRKVQLEDDMRKYILVLLASYLEGNNQSQRFIIWTGSGANGKSTTIEFFQKALGDYYDVLSVSVLTKKRAASSAATPDMAGLKGKRFVIIQEPEGDDKINVGYMKELTGSDMITARPLYRDPIKFRPQFKILLTCNKLPYIPSTDGGTWRRLRVTPWESHFVDVDQDGLFEGEPLKRNQFPRDYELSEKYDKWKAAFMWLLLNVYYKTFKKEGLHEPNKVKISTNKYKKSSDIYFEFINEKIDITEDKKDLIQLSDAYGMFKSWYKESYNNTGCPPKKDFDNYMTGGEYNIVKNCIVGVKFKHGLDDDMDEIN